MTLLETWTSDKGREEVHHFLATDPNTYVFGLNRQLLGDHVYFLIEAAVDQRLKELGHKL